MNTTRRAGRKLCSSHRQEGGREFSEIGITGGNLPTRTNLQISTQVLTVGERPALSRVPMATRVLTMQASNTHDVTNLDIPAIFAEISYYAVRD
jgi:hypothetical protein